MGPLHPGRPQAYHTTGRRRASSHRMPTTPQGDRKGPHRPTPPPSPLLYSDPRFVLETILIGLLMYRLQPVSLFLGELLGVFSFFDLLLQYGNVPANLDDIANAYRVHALIRKLGNLFEYVYILVSVQTVLTALAPGCTQPRFLVAPLHLRWY